ncbi:Alpha/Beta hydrolase protein [Aspergillus pseudotamarii]|uniref:Carboxylic ester hydrolase n=1 Tax=Aspergillus pseudotamarii TaxID=132259 RepID=A0A5N6T5D2_ASPPS|nr:Alpha/Beta hydrolase protein [Aspergillus pseudotamarii]KAE8141459.1 Alpha/Beta hydrolase protein [Aspergillus pseudotamarii]
MAQYILFAQVFLLLFLTAAQEVVVDLEYARYRGRALSNGLVQWLGIRYAASPTGPLRFSAPQTSLPIPEDTSDCLFLDVYSPYRASNHPEFLPVFVRIQGGGFNQNSNPNYNGTGLIQASGMGIFVVTFNHRIQQDGSVNNGLKDQIKVLEWVQKYIHKFGGNPKHVVVGGASAGTASINLLLSAYGGKDDDLFHAAAAESQSFATMLSLNQSQFAYNNLVIRTGCAKVLQRENINTPLANAQQAPLYLYGPVVDGDFVPDYTYRACYFGDDTNEGTIFVPKNMSNVGEVDIFIQTQFPTIKLEQFAAINAWYFHESQTRQFPDAKPYWRPASTAYGEMRYICPGIDMSSIYAKARINSWNYHYAVQDPDLEESGLGVDHIVEIKAIWGPNYVTGDPPSSYFTTNAPIVPVMQGYWTSFIKTFAPNPHHYPGSPQWNTWGNEGYSRIFIKTNETRMEQVSEDQRECCEYLINIRPELQQ